MTKLYFSAALTALTLSTSGVATANTGDFLLNCANHIRLSCLAGATNPDACMRISEDICQEGASQGGSMDWLRRVQILMVPVPTNDDPRYRYVVLNDTPRPNLGEDEDPQNRPGRDEPDMYIEEDLSIMTVDPYSY